MKRIISIFLALLMLTASLGGNVIVFADEAMTVGIESVAATSEKLIVRLGTAADMIEEAKISVHDVFGNAIDISADDIAVSDSSMYINIGGKLVADEVYRLTVTVGGVSVEKYIMINMIFSDDATADNPTEVWTDKKELLSEDYDSYDDGKLVLTNPTDKLRDLRISPLDNVMSSGNQTLEYTVSYDVADGYDMQAYMMSESINYSSGANLFYNLGKYYANRVRVKSIEHPNSANSGYYLVNVPGGVLPAAKTDYTYAGAVCGGTIDIFRNGELLVKGESDLSELENIPFSGTAGFRIALSPGETVRLSNIHIYCVRELQDGEFSVPPKAEDVSITSEETDDGRVLRGNYTFVHADEDEYGTEYAWYHMPVGDTVWSEIPNAATKELSADIVKMYPNELIKFEVMPNTSSGANPIGDDGRLKYRYFAVYAPELAPEASNLRISGYLIPGQSITAEYDYSDYNNDDEGESKITWYSSADINGDYEYIGDGKEYTITEQELGKYIKFSIVPVAVNPPYDGERVESESVYIDALMQINSVELMGEKVIITPADKLSEKFKVYVNGKESVPVLDETSFSVDVDTTVSKNVIQVTDGVKQCYININKNALFFDNFDNDADGWKCEQDNAFQYDAENGRLILKADAKKPVYYDAVDFSRADQAALSDYYVSFDIANKSTELNMRLYTDVLSDFSSNGYRVAVREFATKYYPCGIYRANKSLSYDLLNTKADHDFVYLDSLELPAKVVIAAKDGKQSLMLNGEVIYNASMNHYKNGGIYFTTSGSALDVKIDNVEVYKFNHDVVENIPEISNLKIEGQFSPGSVLTAEYDYSNAGGTFEGEPEYEWYSADSQDGDYELIKGETGKTLTVTSEYADKFIKCEVRPIDKNGVFGIAVMSDYVSKSVKPVVRNARIEGNAIYGEQVTAAYDYYDANHDEQSGDSIQWLMSDNGEDYTLIDGEITDKLTIKDDYAGKYIKARIQIEAANEPKMSDAVDTNPIYIFRRPYVKNVSITNINDKLLNAQYDYVSPDQIQEGNTVVEWYVNGTMAATGFSLDISKLSNASITLRITPYLSEPVIPGEPVTATTSISFGGSGSSSGGRGGGRNSVSVAPSGPQISDIVKTDETRLPQKEYIFADMKGHWAYDSAEKVTGKNIMSASDKGNFFPELLVTRAEFLVYICKTLGIAESEYAVVFDDVSSDDWYAGYIQAALECGFISEDTLFNAYAPITREQACKVISIALGLEGDAQYAQMQFDDFSLIGDWAGKYVGAACKNGIVRGTGNRMFEPSLTIDRGQMSVLIVNILNRIERTD